MWYCLSKTVQEEIIDSFELCDKDISAFILGTGTGGTLMGIEQGVTYLPKPIRLEIEENTLLR